MEHLAELQKDYKGTGVQFLGVVKDIYSWGGILDQRAAGYISSAGVKYPQLCDTPALTVGLNYTPSAHIYDSTGTMIASIIGEQTREEWINIIETLMAKQ